QCGPVAPKSAGPDKGTMFTIRLRAMGASDMTKDPSCTTDPPREASKHRILVVDDNQHSARTMGRLLKLMGHQVHTAYDGIEAVEAAEAFEPEFVLMDVGMPRL